MTSTRPTLSWYGKEVGRGEHPPLGAYKDEKPCIMSRDCSTCALSGIYNCNKQEAK